MSGFEKNFAEKLNQFAEEHNVNERGRNSIMEITEQVYNNFVKSYEKSKESGEDVGFSFNEEGQFVCEPDALKAVISSGIECGSKLVLDNMDPEIKQQYAMSLMNSIA